MTDWRLIAVGIYAIRRLAIWIFPELEDKPKPKTKKGGRKPKTRKGGTQ